MRYKLRIFVVVVILHVIVIFFIWSLLKNPDLLDQPCILAFAGHDISKNETQYGYKTITCNINGEYNVTCRKESDEVYVPFTFIKKYFDVYGRIVEKNGIETFNWSHSYSTIHIPKKKYDPRGLFTHFQSYKVEERERVKCVSGSEGVPVSTQWDPNGYYYPTQIAQFALSHYSKNLMEPDAVRYVLEDGETNRASWSASQETTINHIYDAHSDSAVTCFNSIHSMITLKVNVTLPMLSLNLKMKADNFSRFVVNVRNIVDEEMYHVHYTCAKQHIFVVGNNVHYGLFCKDNSSWYKLSRDMIIDVQKGILLRTKLKPKIPRASYRIDSINVFGEVCLDNLTVLSSDHMTQFEFAVKWFLQHQNQSTGGWPNPVTRKMAGSLRLKPGWYSAMGQGHALSVLSRAYYLDKNKKYLEAGAKALNLFRIPSKDHGLKAMFLNEIPWYEEYPTDPPTFVLNGFMYSLIGLYDFHVLAPTEYSSEAYELYTQGMNSLKKLLMAFDTGSGTIYDLRHITLGIAPKVARWDYHATHINLLYILSTIDRDVIFLNTTKRWIGYMSGKRASHN